MSSYRSLWVLVWCAGCSASADPETFAAQWLRALADGKAERAYQQLCPDARDQLASLSLGATREAPEVFLKRLVGRYGGIDSIRTLEASSKVVDLEISTSRAVLPMRLRRQAKTFCVTLPEP